MATNVPLATDTTPKTRTLATGAVQDVATGRFVAGTALSRDRARELVKSRVERKRRAVQAAAQEAVQSQRLRDNYGDAAWIAEVTQAQMMLATTPDAGKASTIAAEWLVNNAGMGEKLAQQDDKGASVTVSLSAAGLGALVDMLTGREVVEGTVMRNDLEQDEADDAIPSN